MNAQSHHAVFLSYASQDAEAARSICEALRAAGIEVWFDQSELRGGDAWDQKIRNQIRDCALFVPIISEHTASRPEGYFRLEWAIADHRTQMIARNKAFIVPVCVDHTRETIADLPDSFHRVQWTRLPAGETPPSFCQHIATLLGGSERVTTSAHPDVSLAATPMPKAKALAPGHWLLAGVALLLIAGALILKPWRASAPVISKSDTPPVAAPQASAAPERSIAVLPFTDMSEKKDQEYFSDGLSEELIDMLTKVPDLRVPARTSSFYFKGQHATIAEIAKALGVSHVLEGSVRKSGNTLRVTAQLIRADNGYHVWSDTYDRAAQDIFKVQDEIAARVVDALKVSLPTTAATSTGRPENADAYNEYLLGLHFMDRGSPAGFASAEQAFRRAIKLDPNYAAAYARLALAEAYWSDQTGDDSGLKRASGDVEHAITLAPNQADGYFARGYLRVLWLWNFEGAGADLEKAVALDPNNAAILEGYSLLLESRGDLPGALAAVDKAVRLDPLRTAWWQARGLVLIATHDFPEARRSFQRCMELDPENTRAVAQLAIIDMLAGQPQQGLKRLRDAPSPPADRGGGWNDIATALIEHSLGHDAESRRALDEMVRTAARFAAFQIAEIHAWRGEKDQAFDWLDRAYAQRDGGLTRVRTDPLLDPLRSDARFAAFLKKMNLPH